MSARARSTTYASAAVTSSASVARATTGSPGRPGPSAAATGSAGGRCGDLDIGPEVAEPDGEGGVLPCFVERPGQFRPAQLAGLRHDRESRLYRGARVLAGEDLLDQVTGDLCRHLLHDLAPDPFLLAQLRLLRLRQELRDAGVRVEQRPRVAEPELGGVDHGVGGGERQLGVDRAVHRDDLE